MIFSLLGFFLKAVFIGDNKYFSLLFVLQFIYIISGGFEKVPSREKNQIQSTRLLKASGLQTWITQEYEFFKREIIWSNVLDIRIL